jgi:hypothetical protein
MRGMCTAIPRGEARDVDRVRGWKWPTVATQHGGGTCSHGFFSPLARLAHASNLWRTSVTDGEGRHNGEFVRTRVHTVRRAVRKSA